MFLFMGQAIFQHKERIGINSRASTKMLLLKINFRYQFSHLYCLNCLGSMLLFVDAFNNLLILHPTVHVCDIKPSEAATVRHCGTDSQFGCTYFRDSRSTVSLISLVSLTRFKAMPSMSYELVAGPDITCGSWMFSVCRCWSIRCTGMIGMQVNVTTPSLLLIGACLAIVIVFYQIVRMSLLYFGFDIFEVNLFHGLNLL